MTSSHGLFRILSYEGIPLWMTEDDCGRSETCDVTTKLPALYSVSRVPLVIYSTPPDIGEASAILFIRATFLLCILIYYIYSMASDVSPPKIFRYTFKMVYTLFYLVLTFCQLFVYIL